MKLSLRRPRGFAALVALPAALVCAAALIRDSRAAPAAAAMHPAITISHYAFQPATLTVARGSTVTWTNRDEDVHTIKTTDGPEALGSPPLDSGNRFGFTFRRAGTYHYICTVHPYMHGVIVVR